MYCIYSYIQWNLSITFGAMQPGILMYEGSNYLGGGGGERIGGCWVKVMEAWLKKGQGQKPTWEGIVLDA